MRNPLRRYYGRGHLHFITFSCFRQRPLLTVRARGLFVGILNELRRRYEFLLIGYALMPEHVHLLVSEPKKTDLSKVMQVLKQQTSRQLRRKRRPDRGERLCLGFAANSENDNPLWQRRFYDFNVWNAKKMREKLEYMHANPVERKLVQHATDWPWSSWSHYAKGETGLVKIDPPIDLLGSDEPKRLEPKKKNRTLRSLARREEKRRLGRIRATGPVLSLAVLPFAVQNPFKCYSEEILALGAPSQSYR